MILTQAGFDAYAFLSQAQREDAHEAYRIAPDGSPAGARREAEGLLYSLCQTVFAASWAPGFEAEAWTLVHAAADPSARTLDYDDPQGEADVRELRALTIDAGWWPIFDHPHDAYWSLARAVPTDVAAALYATEPAPEGEQR